MTNKPFVPVNPSPSILLTSVKFYFIDISHSSPKSFTVVFYCKFLILYFIIQIELDFKSEQDEAEERNTGTM